jgi:hypothetical protein
MRVVDAHRAIGVGPAPIVAERDALPVGELAAGSVGEGPRITVQGTDFHGGPGEVDPVALPDALAAVRPRRWIAQVDEARQRALAVAVGDAVDHRARRAGDHERDALARRVGLDG